MSLFDVLPDLSQLEMDKDADAQEALFTEYRNKLQDYFNKATDNALTVLEHATKNDWVVWQRGGVGVMVELTPTERIVWDYLKGVRITKTKPTSREVAKATGVNHVTCNKVLKICREMKYNE